MSGAAEAHKGLATRSIHGVLLFAFGGLLFFITRRVPEVHGGMWMIAGFGFLLLAGTLFSELVAPLGLPHLTGYLIAGVFSGPHVLKLVDEQTVKSLSPVNMLALSLIALAGGAELDLASVRKGARTLVTATIVQTVLVLVVMSGVFVAARPFIGFARALPAAGLAGVALLWGTLAVTRSPSATLGILSQPRAHGPLATSTLAFVMTSDLVVVILVSASLGAARPLLDPGAPLGSSR